MSKTSPLHQEPCSLKALIPNSWQANLLTPLSDPLFQTLSHFVLEAYATSKVFPNFENIFKALNEVPFSEVKVVILGQDPYHEEGQAQGLSFSVPEGTKVPPSLRNIFKEIALEMDYTPQATNGDLSRWAKQGVLLLNATLTVEEGHAASHQNKGWEWFTDAILHTLSEKRKGLVFILWGKSALKKKPLIDEAKHAVISGPHPSPLSAYRGFFNQSYFKDTNAYLGQDRAIDWR